MTLTDEIYQDMEIGPDGEIGDWLDVYWCEGHDATRDDFVRAVVEHCIDDGMDIPSIPDDTDVARMWQHDRKNGDSVVYERRDTNPDGSRVNIWRPVTVLDVERRFLGATSCSVTRCTLPVTSSQPFPIVYEVDDSYLRLDLRLCSLHRERIPEQSYRLHFIPVGATIMLAKEDEAEQ